MSGAFDKTESKLPDQEVYMFDILIGGFFLAISLFVSYFLLRNIYGKNFRKWEAIVFTKDVTFRSIFLPESRDESKKEDG